MSSQISSLQSAFRKVFKFCLSEGDSPDRNRPRPALFEPLEDRKLMAVVWANRGSDSFDRFGTANAGAARAIVDEAIRDWNRVVNTPQTLNVTISAEYLPTGVLSGTDILAVNAAKQPTSAKIQLDDNGAGGSWYFDSDPTNDAEFDVLASPFVGVRSAAASQRDLYSTIAHELGHAVGLAAGTNLGINQYLTPVVGNPSLVTFRNPSGAFGTSELLTTTGGLHSTDSLDLMSTSLNVNERRLISDRDARILADAYGYAVTLPSQLDTLYVDSSNGVAVVRGLSGASADTITVSKNGAGGLIAAVNGMQEAIGAGLSDVRVSSGDGNDTIVVNGYSGNFVSVDAGLGWDSVGYTGFNMPGYGYDVSGGTITRPYLSVGPAPLNSVSFNAAEMLSLVTTDLDDVISVSTTAAFSSVSVSALGGNDTVKIMGDNGVIGGAINVNGGAGTDSLIYNGAAAPNYNFVVGGGSIVRQYALTGPSPSNYVLHNQVESRTVNGSDDSDVFVVSSSGLGVSTAINGRNGNDTVRFTEDVIANGMMFDGGAGSDTVQYQAYQSSGYSINVAGNRVSRVYTQVGPTQPNGSSFANTENLSVLGTPGDDRFDVSAQFEFGSVQLSGMDGADTFNYIGDTSTIAGSVVVDGGAGTDSLAYNGSQVGGYAYVIGNGSIYRQYTLVGPTPNNSFTHTGVESRVIKGSDLLNDDFRINTSGVPTTLNGLGGDDVVRVAEDAIATGLVFDGGAGSDSVEFQSVDRSDYSIDLVGNRIAHTYRLVGATQPNGYDFNNAENMTIYGGATAGDLINLTPSTNFAGVLVYGQGGDDTIVGTNSAVRLELFGGAGNDALYGSALNDILVGDAGNDSLIGNQGRDLLFGGYGQDTIQSNDGIEDLVYLQANVYDTNLTALRSIFAEWTSSRASAERRANISGTGTGTRANGNYFLNASTRISDSSFNVVARDSIDWVLS